MNVSMQKNDISNWVDTYNDVVWIDGAPWSLQNRVLEPIHMPHTLQNIDRKKVREALADNNALLAYWSDQWNSSESEWWWTICDNPDYDVENIENARGRRGVRKGLKYCSVHRLEPDKYVKLTYDIFIRNIKSYGSSRFPSFNQYAEDILKKSKYDGYELWGAFVDNKIAAFASCVVLDNALILGSTKSNPDLHSYSPNNALFYKITKHYLCERGVKYVSNGSRTLLHDTSINEFLIRMGYRRNYCRLNIELSKMATLIYKAESKGVLRYIDSFFKFWPEYQGKFQAVVKLINISKSFS